MLDQFGVPGETEGLLGIQVFKGELGYAEPGVFEVPSDELDGVRLRLGPLPDEYFELRALAATQNASVIASRRSPKEHGPSPVSPRVRRRP